MEILIAMILIPGLALLMLYVDGQRRHGLDRDARNFARKLQWILGMVILLHALLFVGWALSELFQIITTNEKFSLEDSIAFVLRFILVGFLVFGGVSALRVSKHNEQSEELSLHEHAKREREYDALRVSQFALIFLPLMVPGSFFLIIFSVFAMIAFSFVAISNQARRNRLLWTLALAAKHKLDFVQEIHELALSEKRKHRHNLRVLSEHLSRGTKLSQALITGPQLLPFEYASAIQAGEDTNSLQTVLPALAIKHSRSLKNFHLDSSLNNIALYSFFVIAMILNVTGFIMYWIIPKYKHIFNDFGMQLPHITESLISTVDAVANFWILLFPLIFLPFLIMVAIIHLSMGPTRWTPRFLYRLFPRLATPQLLRTLGHVAEFSGSIPDSIKTLSDLAANEGWSNRFRRVGRRVEEGENPGKALYGEGVIYRRESIAISNAEALGHLPWAMSAIADTIEKKRINRFRSFVEFVKPIMICLLGLLVLFFAVGMFMPLVKVLSELS